MAIDNTKKKKENIFVLILALCIIAMIAAAILSVVASATEEPIKASILNTTLEAFRKLQPDFNNDPITDEINAVSNGKDKWTLLKKGEEVSVNTDDLVTFYPAKKDGKLICFFMKATSPYGYAGNVTTLAAVNPDGAVENVIVTESNETPGLGTNVYSRELQKTIWGIFKGEYKNMGDKLMPNPLMDFFNGKQYVPDSDYSVSSDKNIIPESKWKVEKDGGDFKYITGATITSRAVTNAVKRMLEAYYQNKTEIEKLVNK